LLNCPVLEPAAKERLGAERAQLDSFALAEAVEKHLRKIARLLEQIAAERFRQDEEGGPCGRKTSSFRRLTPPKKQTKTKPSPVSLNMAQPLAA